jgi:Na+/melibiose symporter-like transporter
MCIVFAVVSVIGIAPILAVTGDNSTDLDGKKQVYIIVGCFIGICLIISLLFLLLYKTCRKFVPL